MEPAAVGAAAPAVVTSARRPRRGSPVMASIVFLTMTPSRWAYVISKRHLQAAVVVPFDLVEGGDGVEILVGLDDPRPGLGV
jgi:hypothetical protein